ncbi:ORF6N domain-containing protein, partial [Cohnella xylanilytica]
MDNKIEYKGHRVLMTTQLAVNFGTDSDRLNNNFARNRSRYIEGKHYFALQGDELKEFKGSIQIDDTLKFASILYLWTKKGAWMHAKSLNTDEAWEAYEALVDDYYEKLERNNNLIDITQLTPELQMFKQLWDGLARSQIEQAETKRIAEAANEKAEKIEGTISEIQVTLLQRNQDWRNSINLNYE